MVSDAEKATKRNAAVVRKAATKPIVIPPRRVVEPPVPPPQPPPQPQPLLADEPLAAPPGWGEELHLGWDEPVLDRGRRGGRRGPRGGAGGEVDEEPEEEVDEEPEEEVDEEPEEEVDEEPEEEVDEEPAEEVDAEPAEEVEPVPERRREPLRARPAPPRRVRIRFTGPDAVETANGRSSEAIYALRRPRPCRCRRRAEPGGAVDGAAGTRRAGPASTAAARGTVSGTVDVDELLRSDVAPVSMP